MLFFLSFKKDMSEFTGDSLMATDLQESTRNLWKKATDRLQMGSRSL